MAGLAAVYICIELGFITQGMQVGENWVEHCMCRW